MRKKQLGVGLGGLLAVSFVLIVVALIGIKLMPSYMEFLSIKKVIVDVARENKEGSTVALLRKSFDLRASIDGIESIKGSDLEITKDGSTIVVSASYRKEIPLVANIGVHIDFHAESKE